MNKFYAVTLMTSFTKVSTKTLAKEFPKQIVYQKKSTVFGKDLYLIRLGFFPSFAAATAMKEKLVGRFPGAWPTEVPEAEQASAIGIGVVAPIGVARAPAPAPASSRTIAPSKVVGPGIYVINLGSAQTPEKLLRTAMPLELNAYRAYVLSETAKGRTQYHFRLGFFPTQSDAEQARSFFTRTYPGSFIVQVTREEHALAVSSGTVADGSQGATPTAGMTSPVPPVRAAPTVPLVPSVPYGGEIQTGEIENQAGVLLAQGRDFITSGDYIQAIQTLNRLLTLPNNKFTSDAVEYIGVARERGGQFELARQVYEMYLRTYPDTEGAQRMRQRLASMAGANVPAMRPVQDKNEPVGTVYGSLSQTYYRGTFTTGVTSLTPTPTPPGLSNDTQRSLISYVDLTARYQGGDYDNRVVLRNKYTYSWLDPDLKDNYLTAAYLDIKDRRRDYSARIGRQPGNTGGVLGIFDGTSVTYNLTPSWYISGSTGVPREDDVNARRYFYSINTGFGPLAQHWYGGFYYVYQFVEGVEDRNAVGAEMRYFEPKRSVYTLVDYDLSFSDLNIAMLQANWLTESNTNYSLLLDHRKARALQATNALVGATQTSYSQLSQSFTSAQLREMAKLHTPEFNFYDFSVSHPVSKTLQLGGRVNMYNISEAAGTAVAQPVPASGNTYIYSLRAIRTSLLFKNDISVLALSHAQGETLQGNGVVISNKSIFQNKWTVDVSLRLTKQTTDSLGSTTKTDNTVTSPLVRLGYQLKQTLVFEVEYGQDRAHLTNAGTSEETTANAKFYSVGYRWNF